jgi:hypothetical protein
MELLLKRDKDAAVQYIESTTQNSINGSKPIF